MDDIREKQIRELLNRDLTFALSVIYDGDRDGAALLIKNFARKIKVILDGEKPAERPVFKPRSASRASTG